MLYALCSMLYALCPLPYAISVGPFGGLLSLPISLSPRLLIPSSFFLSYAMRYALCALRYFVRANFFMNESKSF